MLIPVSFLYSALGINDFSSILFPFLTSIFSIILIFFFGKFLFSEKAGLVAALLISFYPLDVINSTKLLSDLPSAFFSGLSVFLFLMAEKLLKSPKSYLLYALSGISLGIAFTIKEMAVLTILFFLGYVTYIRKIKTAYFIQGICFLLILVMSMLFYYNYTGSPFFRFTTSDEHLQAALYHDAFGRLSLPKFFVTWPYVIFGDMQLGYFFTFIFLAIFYFIFHRKKETDYLFLWLLSILFYFYFGTTSLKLYVPIVAVSRFLNLITIPGILILAAFLVEQQKIIKKIVLPFTIVFLLFTSLGAVYLDTSRNSLNGLRQVYSEIKIIEKPIYTDYRSIMVLSYISGYDNKLSLIDLDSDPKKLKDIKDAYVVINNQMIKRLIAAKQELEFPSEIDAIPNNWTKVKEIGKSDENIIIYYANNRSEKEK
ncbi:glycosyltransferase family 39 protein [Candidatus Woesearchaeota archaeon]|nr:glycosyltransferase family 39 protein [Candidatus Woesearchaeota archaeon]